MIGSRETHLRALADELALNVKLDQTPDPRVQSGINGRAKLDQSVEVRGWDEDRQAAYFAGLHELGHWARGHMIDLSTRYWSRMVEAEAEAWEWALDNASEPPDDETVAIIRDTWLGSYLRDCVGTAAGMPGPTFHKVAAQIGLNT